MSKLTVLVLADPEDKTLSMLDRLAGVATIVCGNTVESFREAASGADVILNWTGDWKLFEQVWAISPHVRWVHSRSAGVESALSPAFVASNVPLTNSRTVFSRPLGEFAMAAVLFFAKNLRRMVQSQQAGKWDPFDVTEVCGSTLGIIGYGDIGRACAACARPFGMKIVALRRRPELSIHDPLVDVLLGPAQLKSLLTTADYVVVSTPLTEATRGLIGENELRCMKPSAVLINLGRGPVVEEKALIRALEQHWIRGAALDVFDTEPLPEGHAFYRLENLLLSPHCADHTSDWLERAMSFFLANFERFCKGEPFMTVVDKRSGY